ncbi:MAG: DinB family protein [Aureliella sp.]
MQTSSSFSVWISAFAFTVNAALFCPSSLAQSLTEAPTSNAAIEPGLLLENPPEIPAHLRDLFDHMEASNRRSQDVFRALSTNQMNFKPSNGSHTPRWNAEHMAGRQLLFFSQIYHAIDPEIPVFNWNPAQMPADYKARHSDWSGKDEARMMQRVDDFCRRYAYLLKDVSLDEKPPATSWPSLRALLLQMERHYDEHTANVKKKFDLPDWPKE